MTKNPENLRIPHINLADEVNSKILGSAIEGGALLNEFAIGSILEIKTQNTLYTLEIRKDGTYISGHKTICPKPVRVTVLGSAWEPSIQSMLKQNFIGRGMHLQFIHPDRSKYKAPIITTIVEEITQINKRDT